MSKMLMPIPVGNPVLDGPNAFNIAWQKYLKAIGDDLLTANKVQNITEVIQNPNYPNDPTKKLTVNTGLQYVVNGNTCSCIFDKQLTADKTIALPYPALLRFEAGGTIYPVGTKSITFTVAVPFMQFWYVVDFGK